MNYKNFTVIDIDKSQGISVNNEHSLRFSSKCEGVFFERITVFYFNIITGEEIRFDDIDGSQMEVTPPSPLPDGVYDVRVRKADPVMVTSKPYRLAIGAEGKVEHFAAEHTVKPNSLGTLQCVSPIGRCCCSNEQETITFNWKHDGVSPLCYQVVLINQKTGKFIRVWRGIAPDKRTLTVEDDTLALKDYQYRWRVLAIYLQCNIKSDDSAFEIAGSDGDSSEKRQENNNVVEQKKQGEFSLPVVSKEVVRLEDVGVCFRKSGGNLLKKMNFSIKSLLPSPKQKEQFWALKKISFSLEHGDILGIIGNNGAGKSTLLKVLTGVLLPDTGSVAMHGRISSLLALGAGFMPYLSGRENIYLNGMYMGMSKEKIGTIFNEIVEFSELEAFIDTPIRYYSSGMKARLGFSVAVHVEPEILVVDEVLATGDKNFRVKAEEKMKAFMEKAKVLIIASHSMKLISDLTNKCLYLERGTIKHIGPTQEVVTMYNEN